LSSLGVPAEPGFRVRARRLAGPRSPDGDVARGAARGATPLRRARSRVRAVLLVAVPVDADQHRSLDSRAARPPAARAHGGARPEDLGHLHDGDSRQSRTRTLVREPQPNDVLDGRFEIAAEIARSGMATVFKAHDRSTGRPVALKIPFFHFE